MVMHSNERGECCPRTLVDRKRKCYDNAVDVVIRLHDPTDTSTERTALPSSAHVRYLIGRIVKTFDYINRVVITLPLSVYEGTWTTLSPLVAMHHHDLACA